MLSLIKNASLFGISYFAESLTTYTDSSNYEAGNVYDDNMSPYFQSNDSPSRQL